jgi:molybdopterin/thiamine biosynthesis adenylyltransferase
MNKAKLLEFFDASEVRQTINVVGCGAIGSHVCEQLARLGFTKVNLYDFDTVEAHNITNQMFYEGDIGLPKVECCKAEMVAINPELKNCIRTYEEGLKAPYILNGIIIMCVDNIDLRREIVKANQYNPNCTAITDFRMRLTDAQCYFADTHNKLSVKAMLDSMDFTHDEAVTATPKSACGYELSVIYTVKMIVSAGIANFVRYLQGQVPKKLVLIDMNMFTLDAFDL